MEYSSGELNFFKELHPPSFQFNQVQENQDPIETDTIGKIANQSLTQTYTKDDFPFLEQLSRGQKLHEKTLKKLKKEEIAANAKAFVKSLGKENIPAEKKSVLLARREQREKRMMHLFENRQQIIKKPPELEKKVMVLNLEACDNLEKALVKGKLEKASYERTETGAYALTGHILGKGEYKKAKFALELISDELYVRTSAPQDAKDYKKTKKRLKQEIEMLSLFKGEKEFVQLVHSYWYDSNKGFKKLASMMEYCNGGNLEELQEAKSMRPENFSERKIEQLKSIFHDILLAMVKMHAKGVVHRDIKAANIFLMKDADGNFQAKIGDFGISTYMDNKSHEITGSPLYVSPENLCMLDGKNYNLFLNKHGIEQSEAELIASPKNDVWSFGVMIYYFLYDAHFLEDMYGNYDDLNFFYKSIPVKLANLDQKVITKKLNKKFYDPFAQGLQDMLKHILIINPNQRPSAKTVYRRYCKKFDLPAQI